MKSLLSIYPQPEYMRTKTYYTASAQQYSTATAEWQARQVTDGRGGPGSIGSPFLSIPWHSIPCPFSSSSSAAAEVSPCFVTIAPIMMRVVHSRFSRIAALTVPPATEYHCRRTTQLAALATP